MKVIVVLALGVAIILSPYVTSADFLTGKDLYLKLGKRTSVEKNNSKDYYMALGYIIGVFDAYNEIAFHAPPDVTRSQVKEIAVKFMKNNPEKLDQPADVVLSTAFKEAFRKTK